MPTIIGEIECQNGQLNKIRLGDNSWQPINAYIYLPSNYSPENKYPLICFWHGVGEAGNGTSDYEDLPKLLEQGLPYVYNEHINSGDIASTDLDKFIMLAIQGISGWCPSVQAYLDAITYLKTKLSIDANKIYATGLSAGGTQSADAMCDSSKTFVAGVIMSPVGIRNDFTNYVDAWAWYFNGISDPTAIIGNSESDVNSINSSYPNHAQLTSYDGGHGDWIPHYEPSWQWTAETAGSEDIGKPNGLNIYQWMLQYSLDNSVESGTTIIPVLEPAPSTPTTTNPTPPPAPTSVPTPILAPTTLFIQPTAIITGGDKDGGNGNLNVIGASVTLYSNKSTGSYESVTWGQQKGITCQMVKNADGSCTISGLQAGQTYQFYLQIYPPTGKGWPSADIVVINVVGSTASISSITVFKSNNTSDIYNSNQDKQIAKIIIDYSDGTDEIIK